MNTTFDPTKFGATLVTPTETFDPTKFGATPTVRDVINQHNADESISTSNPSFPAEAGENPIKAGVKAIGNIPSSLMNLGGSVINSVTHPIDTVKNVLSIGAGGASELGRFLGTGANVGKPKTGEEEVFDHLKQVLLDRYGSLEKAQKTATEDPIGFGADVMSVISGGATLAGKGAELDSLLSKVGGPGSNLVEKAKDATGISKLGGFNPLAPFKESANPEIAKMFESEGIKPPVSALTDSPYVKGSESILGKGIFGRKITQDVETATSQLDQKVHDIVSAITPEKAISDENLGKTLQEGLKEYEDKFKITEGKVYDEFSKTYGTSNVYGMKTKDALQTLIKEQGNDYFGGVDSRLTRMLNKLTGNNDPELKGLNNTLEEAKNAGASPDTINKIQGEIDSKQSELDKNLTFNELKSTRSSVGEQLQKEPTNTALKRLYGALSTDMQTAIGDVIKNDPLADDSAKMAKVALDKLNEGYRTGKAKIESNIAQSISKSNPESIAKNLVKRNSADTLAQVKEMVGPDRFSEVQKSFLRNTFDDSVKNGKFSVDKLKKTLSNYDQETIDQLLSPEQQKNLDESISKLDKYQKMGESLKKGQKMAEGSQTAFLQKITSSGAKMTTFAAALAAGNIPIILSLGLEVGGEALAAKLFNSEIGRKWLTEGLAGPKTPELLSKMKFSPAEKSLLLQVTKYTKNNE